MPTIVDMTAAELSPLHIYLENCLKYKCKPNSLLRKTLPGRAEFEKVEVLDLSQNFVGPKGLLPVLEVAKRCPNLNTLNLKDNQLDNNSVREVVAAITGHGSLKRLDLSSNPITISAGQSLLELAQRSRNLHEINVSGTSLRPIMMQCIENQCARNARASGSSTAESPMVKFAAALAEAQNGTLEECSLLALLATIPSTLTPMLYDINPVDGFTMLCQQHSATFRDPQFPPTLQSVQRMPGKDYGVRIWRRVSELAERDAVLFSGRAKPSLEGIVLGAANDSVVLASLSEILRASSAFNPLAEAIYPPKLNPAGVYSVRFYIDGKWRYILVDDWIPCDEQGRAAFLRPTKGSEVWIYLLEKAVAKLYGSYQALDSTAPRSPDDRSVSSAILMKDLTAGVGISRDLNHAEFEPDKWWLTLEDISSRGALCTTDCAASEKAEKAALGLSAGTTYILKSAQSVNGFRLVYLHSDWVEPGLEWTGEWSRKSTLWTEHQDVAGVLKYDPEKALQGGFWIPYHLFLRHFSSISICRIFENQTSVHVQGKWQGRSAGGPYFESSWGYNPHYEVRMHRPGVLFVHLALPDPRYGSSAADTIALHLVKADRYPISFDPDACVGKTAYIISDSVTFEGFVAEGSYWLVPSTYTAAQESPFLLSLFSPQPMTLVEQPIEPFWKELRLESAWKEGSGEYQAGDDNPQFELIIPEPAAALAGELCKCSVTMSVDPGQEYSIIFFICSAPSATESQRFVGVIPESEVIFKSKFVISRTVSHTMALPAGRYNVVCCLQPEGSVSRCSLSFWCSRTSFMVRELPLWTKKTVKGEWRLSGQYQSADRHPQFELVAHKPTQVVIRAQVSLCCDPALAVFVMDNTKNAGKRWKGYLLDSNIVAQSAYVRSESVSLQVELPKAGQPLLIVPNLQPPGSKGRLHLSVSCPPGDDFELREVPE
eukprot:RCo018690